MEMKLSQVQVFAPVVFTFHIGVFEVKAFCEPNSFLPVEKANYQLSLEDFEIYEDTQKVFEKLKNTYPNDDFEKKIDDTVNQLFIKLYNHIKSLSQNILMNEQNFTL